MDIWQDIRFAIRSLLRSGTFTMAAVLCLALGVGATSAVFGIVDALFFRPPPGVGNPDAIVRPYLYEKSPHVWMEASGSVSYPDYRALRDEARTLSGLAGYTDLSLSVGSGIAAENADAQAVSGNYFDLLQVAPARGRFFRPDEDAGPGSPPVLVISHAYWSRRFGGDPGVLGQSLEVNGHSYRIIGVAPVDFHGIDVGTTDFWIPVSHAAQLGLPTQALEDRTIFYFHPVGRLAPGATMAAAEAELGALLARVVNAAEPDRHPTLRLGPILRDRGPEASRQAMVTRWLALAAGLVLLIACANTANLLLARSATRRREIAIRLAVGATRRRLSRLLLTESALLGLAGTVAGVVLALWGTELIPADGLTPLRLFAGGRVLLFAIAQAVLTTIAFGVVPAIAATRSGPSGPMRENERAGRPRSALRESLLVVQVALAVVLLTGAGLFVHSLRNVERIEPGIMLDRIVVGRVNLRAVGYGDTAIASFDGRALERLSSTPGVVAATLASLAPLEGGFQVLSFAVPDGTSGRRSAEMDLRQALDGPAATYAFVVGPDYFTTVGTAILRGRDFSRADWEHDAKVAIVNSAFATREWPAGSAIGRCIDLGGSGKPDCFTVIGVVANAKYSTLEEPTHAAFFLPLESGSSGSPNLRLSVGGGGTLTFLIRTTGDPGAAIPSLRGALATLATGLPYVHLQTLEQTLRPMLQPRRLGASMFGVFGVVALVLAAIGLYGVVAYTVTQRTREVGIRMALGARSSHVLSLVVGQVLVVTTAGLLAGMLGALAGARLVTHLLFGVGAGDPLTYVGVGALLIVTAVVASFVPARRAISVDPMVALRTD